MNSTTLNKERNRKRKYLERYKKLMERSIFLDNDIHSIKSVDHNHIKTTAKGKSLTDKMHELDKVCEDMANIENAIESIGNLRLQTVLGYRYLLFKRTEEIAEIMHYCDTTIKRDINKALDRLDI